MPSLLLGCKYFAWISASFIVDDIKIDIRVEKYTQLFTFISNYITLLLLTRFVFMQKGQYGAYKSIR